MAGSSKNPEGLAIGRAYRVATPRTQQQMDYLMDLTFIYCLLINRSMKEPEPNILFSYITFLGKGWETEADLLAIERPPRSLLIRAHLPQ